MSDHDNRVTLSAEEQARIEDRTARAVASIERKRVRRERAGAVIGMAAGGFGESSSQGWMAKVIKSAPFALGTALLGLTAYLFFRSLMT